MIFTRADNFKMGSDQVSKIYLGTKLIWPRCATLPNGVKWCLTLNTYDSLDETATRQGIKNEFGDNAVPLDWTDLQDYYNTYGHLDILREIPFRDGLTRPNGGVIRNGNWFYSSDRPYFVDEEGKYYNSSFNAHDYIGPGEGPHGYDLLDLGSWKGNRQYYVKINI
jgi:hypothetical protein